MAGTLCDQHCLLATGSGSCLYAPGSAGNWCPGGYDGCELFNETNAGPLLRTDPGVAVAWSRVACAPAGEVDAFLLEVADDVVVQVLWPGPGCAQSRSRFCTAVFTWTRSSWALGEPAKRETHSPGVRDSVNPTTSSCLHRRARIQRVLRTRTGSTIGAAATPTRCGNAPQGRPGTGQRRTIG